MPNDPHCSDERMDAVLRESLLFFARPVFGEPSTELVVLKLGVFYVKQIYKNFINKNSSF